MSGENLTRESEFERQILFFDEFLSIDFFYFKDAKKNTTLFNAKRNYLYSIKVSGKKAREKKRVGGKASGRLLVHFFLISKHNIDSYLIHKLFLLLYKK